MRMAINHNEHDKTLVNKHNEEKDNGNGFHEKVLADAERDKP